MADAARPGVFVFQSQTGRDRAAGLVQVLHMDRNNYYGGESTSFNLNQVGSSTCFSHPCTAGAAVLGWLVWVQG